MLCRVLEHNLLSVRDDMLVFLQIEGIPNNYEKNILWYFKVY